MMNNKPEELWAEALDEDALESVTGGAGANNGIVVAEGTVIGPNGSGKYQVSVNGQTIIAHLSGELRMNYIRIMPGNRVRVEYTPDNLRGRITWRYK